jgi:hypothetical protein
VLPLSNCGGILHPITSSLLRRISMSDDTGRRAGSKSNREPLFAATGAFGQDKAEIYEFGPFRLESAERKLSRHNEPVVLTPKALTPCCFWFARAAICWRKTNLSGPFGPTLSSKKAI